MVTDARTPTPNHPGPPDATGQDAGVEGNARLTASNGLLLIALLAVEGVTILDVRQMITLHMYLGILLLGPVLLKTASTVYRFARYYRGAGPYRRKGPPHPVLRLLGPAVILTTLAVLGTGIGLIATGPRHREPLLTLHQASFIAWVALMAIHILGHLREASLDTWRDLRSVPGDAASTRRAVRAGTLIAALLIGVGAATALMPSASAWTSGNIGFEHRR
ncbi:MAG: hypothetical protein ACR2LX_01890 [Jatrophihabitans sp.]